MNGERIAFENWLGIKPCGAAHDLAWAAWKARASLPAPQQATPASAPQSLLMRLAGIAAECSDPDTTDALDALIATTQQATPGPVGEAIKYQPGEWYEAKDRDDLEAFFRSRLPAIREAAREHGYAIGLHGSMRRDLDLIAAPWREGAADKDVLAHAIAMAACGITRDGPYQWEQKPLGRVATSLSCCWPRWFNEAGAGHIDLSIVDPSRPTAAPEPGVPEGLPAVLTDWGFDVHDDEEGRTWLLIRNDQDDVARLSVPTFWPASGRQTIGAVVLHQFSAALTSALAAAQAKGGAA